MTLWTASSAINIPITHAKQNSVRRDSYSAVARLNSFNFASPVDVLTPVLADYPYSIDSPHCLDFHDDKRIRSTLPRVAIEILLPSILPYLDSKSLHHVSLVSKYWRDLSLRFLYCNIESTSPLKYSRSLSSYSSFQNASFVDRPLIRNTDPPDSPFGLPSVDEDDDLVPGMLDLSIDDSPKQQFEELPNNLFKYVRGLKCAMNSDNETSEWDHIFSEFDHETALTIKKNSYQMQNEIIAHLLQTSANVQNVYLEDVHYEQFVGLDPAILKAIPATMHTFGIRMFRPVSSPGNISNQDLIDLVNRCPNVRHLSFHLLGSSAVTLRSIIHMVNHWKLDKLDLNLRLDFPSRQNPLVLYEQLGTALIGKVPHVHLNIDYFYKCRPVFSILAGLSFTIETLEIKRKAMSSVYECLDALYNPQDYLPFCKNVAGNLEPCGRIKSFKWYFDKFEDNMGANELAQFDRFLSKCKQLESLYINYEPNSLSYLVQSIGKHCPKLKQLTLVRNLPKDDPHGHLNRVVKVKHVDLMNLVKNCHLLERLELDCYVPSTSLHYLNKIVNLSFYYAEEVDSMRFGSLLSASCDSKVRSVNMTLSHTMNADHIAEMVKLGLLRNLDSFIATSLALPETLRYRDEFCKCVVDRLSGFYDAHLHYWPPVLKLDRLQYTKVGTDLYLCHGTCRRKKPVLVFSR